MINLKYMSTVPVCRWRYCYHEF